MARRRYRVITRHGWSENPKIVVVDGKRVIRGAPCVCEPGEIITVDDDDVVGTGAAPGGALGWIEALDDEGRVVLARAYAKLDAPATAGPNWRKLDRKIRAHLSQGIDEGLRHRASPPDDLATGKAEDSAAIRTLVLRTLARGDHPTKDDLAVALLADGDVILKLVELVQQLQWIEEELAAARADAPEDVVDARINRAQANKGATQRAFQATLTGHAELVKYVTSTYVLKTRRQGQRGLNGSPTSRRRRALSAHRARPARGTEVACKGPCLANLTSLADPSLASQMS